MVPKNRKNYPINVRFLHQAAEKSNLNIVHVVDREKDGARIFFLLRIFSIYLFHFQGQKSFFFIFSTNQNFHVLSNIGRKITITNLCDREEFEKLVGQL